MFSRNGETTVNVTVNIVPYGIYQVTLEAVKNPVPVLSVDSGEVYSFPSETARIVPEFLSSSDVQVI